MIRRAGFAERVVRARVIEMPVRIEERRERRAAKLLGDDLRERRALLRRTAVDEHAAGRRAEHERVGLLALDHHEPVAQLRFAQRRRRLRGRGARASEQPRAPETRTLRREAQEIAAVPRSAQHLADQRSSRPGVSPGWTSRFGRGGARGHAAVVNNKPDRRSTSRSVALAGGSGGEPSADSAALNPGRLPRWVPLALLCACRERMPAASDIFATTTRWGNPLAMTTRTLESRPRTARALFAAALAAFGFWAVASTPGDGAGRPSAQRLVARNMEGQRGARRRPPSDPRLGRQEHYRDDQPGHGQHSAR